MVSRDTGGPPQADVHGQPTESAEVAHKVMRWLAADQSVTGAFIAGSITAGLASSASDIDVYLVVAGRTIRRQQLWADGYRIDVHRVAERDLIALVDRVLAVRMVSTEPTQVLTAQEVSLAVRLAGAEVLPGKPAVQELQDRLLGNAGQLRRVTIDHWLQVAMAELEDYQALVGRDPDAALVSGRVGLLAAGKAVAAACGDMYTGRKYVFRQLERSAPRHFELARFRRLLRSDLSEVRGDLTFSDLERFTQTCLIAVATVGWHGLSMQLWPQWINGNGSLRRASSFCPRALHDAVVLGTPGRRWVRLRPEVALIWGLCDAVAQPDLIARAMKLTEATDSYRFLTESRCRAIIDTLLASDLVTEG